MSKEKQELDTVPDLIGAQAAQLAMLFDQSPSFMAVLEGPSHVMVQANASYLRLVGDRRVVGLTVAEALPDAQAQGYGALLDEVFATGRPYSAFGAQFRVQVAPGGAVVDRFVDFVYQPLKQADGRVKGIFVEGHDVSGRTQATALHLALVRLTDKYQAHSDRLGSSPPHAASSAARSRAERRLASCHIAGSAGAGLARVYRRKMDGQDLGARADAVRWRVQVRRRRALHRVRDDEAREESLQKAAREVAEAAVLRALGRQAEGFGTAGVLVENVSTQMRAQGSHLPVGQARRRRRTDVGCGPDRRGRSLSRCAYPQGNRALFSEPRCERALHIPLGCAVKRPQRG